MDVFIRPSFESDIRTYCRIILCLQFGLKARHICVGNPSAGIFQGLGGPVLEKPSEYRNAQIRVANRTPCVPFDIYHEKRRGKPAVQSYQIAPDQD